MRRVFRLVKENNWIGGVCGGLAYWLGIPVWIVRMIWTASVVYFGVGFLLYVILWIFVPNWDEDPKDYDEITGG
jgi:phage shock protein PspC (stress-responsive transcriptional regulator)